MNIIHPSLVFGVVDGNAINKNAPMKILNEIDKRKNLLYFPVHLTVYMCLCVLQVSEAF